MPSRVPSRRCLDPPCGRSSCSDRRPPTAVCSQTLRPPAQAPSTPAAAPPATASRNAGGSSLSSASASWRRYWLSALLLYPSEGHTSDGPIEVELLRGVITTGELLIGDELGCQYFR